MKTTTNESKGSLLKIGDAAKLLHISPQTLRDWSDEGKISPVVSDGGHRTYYEADVKKLALANQGVKTFWMTTVIVAIPADKSKVYYVNVDTYEQGYEPAVTEVPIDKYWDYNNGLQKWAHTAVLNEEPTVLPIEDNGEAYPLDIDNQVVLALSVTVVNVHKKDLPSALDRLKASVGEAVKHLEENYTAQQTVTWYDKTGQQLSL